MRKIVRGDFNEEMMGDKEGTVRELVRLTTQEGLYHENAAIRGYSTYILSHLVFKKLYTEEAHMEQVAKGINELYTSGQYNEGIECLTDLTFSDNYPVASLNREFIETICKAIEAKRAALLPTCLSKMVLCEKTHEAIVGLIEKELDGGNETLKSIMNDFLMQLLDELELLHESEGNPTVHDTAALRGLLAKLEQWEGALQDKFEEIRNMLAGGKPSFLS